MDKKSSAKKIKREDADKETILKKPELQEEQKAQKMRRVHIETDGTSIHISLDETAGKLELLAILQALIGSLTSPK